MTSLWCWVFSSKNMDCFSFVQVSYDVLQQYLKIFSMRILYTLIELILRYMCLIWINWHLTFILISFFVPLWITRAERQKEKFAFPRLWQLEFWMWLSFDQSHACIQEQKGGSPGETLLLLLWWLAGELGLTQVFTAPGLNILVSNHQLYGHEKIVMAAAVTASWSLNYGYDDLILKLLISWQPSTLYTF